MRDLNELLEIYFRERNMETLNVRMFKCLFLNRCKFGKPDKKINELMLS